MSSKSINIVILLKNYKHGKINNLINNYIFMGIIIKTKCIHLVCQIKIMLSY